jgi:LysM repeat protein
MKIILAVLLFFTFPCIRPAAQIPADVVNYVNTYKGLAMSEMQRTGIPASIILAQGIHETQAGTSDLVKKSNNHFGIKCKDSWTGAVVYHDDDRSGECFRSYGSPRDSYVDHSDFLRNGQRYQFLFKISPENYQGWAYGLKKAGYATNTKYPQILIKLIEDYNLQQYTEIAMGRLKPSDEVVQGGDQHSPAAPVVPVADSGAIVREKADLSSPVPESAYPEGEFMINNSRVIFASAGSSLLAIANQYDLQLPRLLEFNDMKQEDVLVKGQLLFLQRKRKTGMNEFHVVHAGETLYDISQSEGIRYESILSLNQLSAGEEPAVGEKLYLQSTAPSRPVLRGERVLQTTAASQSMAMDGLTEKNNLVTHIVQSKETLYSISQKFGVGVGKIRQWNNLDSPNLSIGQALIIYKN